MKRKYAHLLGPAVLACAGLAAGRAGPAQAPGRVSFAEEIQPVLAASCLGCHGPNLQMAGLRLDSRRAAVAGDPAWRAP